MPTPEEMAYELQQQRATPRQIVSPDVGNSTRLAQRAAQASAINRELSLTDPNHRQNVSRIGIGTNPIYSTLPANAGKLNFSSKFTIAPAPP